MGWKPGALTKVQRISFKMMRWNNADASNRGGPECDYCA